MGVQTEILEISLRAILVSGSATILAALWSLPLGIFLGLKKFNARGIVKGFFNRLLLGSTSTHVLRHGECATLVVPRPEDAG